MIGRVRAWYEMYVTQHYRGYRLVILGLPVLQTFRITSFDSPKKIMFPFFFGTNKLLNFAAFIVVDRSD